MKNKINKIFSLSVMLMMLLTLKMNAQWVTSGTNIYNSNTGNVGIGLTLPASKFQVLGESRFGSTTNYVKVNASGYLSFAGAATMNIAANKYVFKQTSSGNRSLYINKTDTRFEFRDSVAADLMHIDYYNGNTYIKGKLGIGTTTPATALEINGQIKITGGTPGAGKVLTSDATGLASWQSSTSANTSLSNLVSTSVNQNLLPNSTNTKDIGSTSKAWKNIYTSGKIYFDGVQFIHNGTPAYKNIFIGENAGFSDTLGQHSIAIGTAALYYCEEKDELVAIGDSALAHNGLNATGNQEATQNTAVGHYALKSNEDGYGNTALGYSASAQNTSGYANTAIGTYTMNENKTGYGNTALGYDALGGYSGNKNYNVALGYQPLVANSGNNNIAIGDYVMYGNSGENNTAIGSRALYYNTTYHGNSGSNNTVIGYKALGDNTNGSNNSALGYKTLYTNQGGDDNVTTGDSSMYKNSSGSRNTASGVFSLGKNDNGNNNSSFGYFALNGNTSGLLNVAVGSSAMAGNTTGSFNTALGAGCDVSSGNFFSSTVIGYFALVNASNKMQLGSSTSVLATTGGITIVSDGRFKDNITADDVAGLEFINKLTPVNYNFNYKKFDDFLRKDLKNKETTPEFERDLIAKGKTREVGFIAQDVDEICRENNYTFNGVYTPQNSNDNYALDYSRFVVPLVKSVQELSKQNEQLKKDNDDLKKDNAETKARLDAIEKSLAQCCTNYESGKNTRQSSDNSITDLPELEQNQPNPFNTESKIKFYVPSSFHSAQIVVKDVSGQQLKTFEIKNAGYGEITIQANEFAAGSYLYSLVVDGKKVDGKKMELTK